ncbi:MAG: hypothetical protein CVV24_13875 [Ignavibacteriae bacterium HGW-Ignavibacteriae-3]|nr:MAG: hypothetical protein CVV24_13875 [Ignavibacteriae bacterium HGW-Ignavibacteriae-3]
MKNFEIFFRKFLLRLLLLLRKNSNENAAPLVSKESRILFVRLNRIGDALVTTPLLREVKEKLGCRIFVLAGSQNYFVFENQKIADEIIVYRKNVHGIRSLIKLINELHFDVIVDLHDDVSSTVSYLIAFSNCRYKFGLKKKNFKIFTHTVDKPDPTRNHVIERILEFRKLFNININSDKANIVFEPKSDSIQAASDFVNNHFPSKKFLVGINISAGSEARFWGISKFRQLIAELSSYDVEILLLCSEKDLHNANQIAVNGVPIYYRPSFDEFCAIIPFLDFLVTPDTSIIHVASAYYIPLFGLFVQYNTREMIWSPFRSEFGCVITHEQTLKNISNESVNNKLIPLFEKVLNKKEKHDAKNPGM